MIDDVMIKLSEFDISNTVSYYQSLRIYVRQRIYIQNGLSHGDERCCRSGFPVQVQYSLRRREEFV
jgi:hypothetical protein